MSVPAVSLPACWRPIWFQEVFRGSAEPLPWPDDHPPLATPRSPSQVFGFYHDQCRVSDAIIAEAPLTASPVGRHPNEPLASQTIALRRIILHVIEETARHAGHLDAARELIDGRTGLGPR